MPSSPDHKAPQRQDSLTDQLRDLDGLACKYGMYDASEFLRRHLQRPPDKALSDEAVEKVGYLLWKHDPTRGRSLANDLARTLLNAALPLLAPLKRLTVAESALWVFVGVAWALVAFFIVGRAR